MVGLRDCGNLQRDAANGEHSQLHVRGLRTWKLLQRNWLAGGQTGGSGGNGPGGAGAGGNTTGGKGPGGLGGSHAHENLLNCWYGRQA